MPRAQLEIAITSSVPGFEPKSRRMLTEADDLDSAADEVASKNKNEVCWSLSFLPAFVGSLFRSGFLPIAANMGNANEPLWVLMPKLHSQRCICQWQEVHVSRNSRKQSSKYELSFDQAFDRVVEGVLRQHRECWLYPPLASSLHVLQGDGPLARVVSVELWHKESGDLAAGELGVIVGSVYTSLTGYCDKVKYSGSGRVQLLALAGILQQIGVSFWDLGMGLDYKTDLGGHEVHRKEFLKMFRASRGIHVDLPKAKIDARVAIDSLLSWQNREP